MLGSRVKIVNDEDMEGILGEIGSVIDELDGETVVVQFETPEIGWPFGDEENCLYIKISHLEVVPES